VRARVSSGQRKFLVVVVLRPEDCSRLSGAEMARLEGAPARGRDGRHRGESRQDRPSLQRYCGANLPTPIEMKYASINPDTFGRAAARLRNAGTALPPR
jgi:hypothetical protein